MGAVCSRIDRNKSFVENPSIEICVFSKYRQKLITISPTKSSTLLIICTYKYNTYHVVLHIHLSWG
jgi:hypothetical protein